MFFLKKKEVVICIHGFGLRRKAEFDFLKSYLEKRKIKVITFDMYKSNTDSSWIEWVNKAEKIIKDYDEKNYQINLIGFSMGGVIASYLAAHLKIQKLILLAPAFEYFDIDSARRFIKTFINLSDTEKENYIETRVPEYEYFISFAELIKKLKKSVKMVSCPIMILQGTKDEFVPIKSSRYAYNNVSSTSKHCMFIEGASHELQSFDYKEEVGNLIYLFLNNKI